MNSLMLQRLQIGVFVLLLFAAPTVAYPVFLMKIMCFAIFAGAFNLLIGFTGLLSFGHAAFFGGSAYITGYLIASKNVSVPVGMLAGVLAAAAMGLVVGAFAIRRRGIYFTMITMALAQMLYFVWLQAPFTGGEDGLQGIPRGNLFGIFDLNNNITMYYFVLAVTLACFAFVYRIVHSPFGQIIKTIKENEPRAISLGYEVNRYKLLAFVLSAALSGLAGSLKGVVLGFVTLADVHWSMSGMVVLMTLVGGLGTYVGPFIGAALLVALDNKLSEIGRLLSSATGLPWLATMGESVTLVIGLIFIFCVLALRRGVVGELNALTRKLFA
ncbi:urea ABC transporter, permease protein UrtC [compost metagenome]